MSKHHPRRSCAPRHSILRVSGLRRLCCLLFVALVPLAIPVAQVSADVSLPAIIGDNMVLQQGIEIHLWGKAEPGEKIEITLGSISKSIAAGKDGRWMVKFPALDIPGPIAVHVAGKNTIILKNVLVGDVWVCSGQSNMAFTVSRGNDAQQEIANANYPKIRLFNVTRSVAHTPQTDLKGAWVECSPETVGNFSAVGYFFGRDLHKSHGQPIGLINTSVGGTPSEAWTSAEMLKSDRDFQPILDRWDEIIANADQYQAKYEQQVKKWQAASQEAKAAGKPAPRRPRPPYGPNHSRRPSNLYNAMIAPLIPFAIKGAIWYQGEANASRAFQYRKLFPAMIRDWRKQWQQGDFPFLFVQLANYRARADQPGPSDWAELREAQTMTLSLPNTGMAVTIDIGEANDIHPKNKQDVGRRLAKAAKAVAYGEDVVPSGPMLKSMTIENDRVRIAFNHVGGGLKVHGKELQGFAVAGDDQEFHWAKARIDGDTVIVHSAKVKNPIAVRYAWANNPACNLFNAEGLPAVSFRTDSWPGVTDNER